MTKSTRTDLSRFSGKAAHARSRALKYATLLMAHRWRHVSDKTVAAMLYVEYGTNRPRYGAQLARAGLLIKHKIPTGCRVDGARQVYSLSREGYAELNDLIRSADACEERHKPAWSTMQHLLDLQLVAVAHEEMDITSFQWLTEPETRESFAKRPIVPDLAFEYRPAGCWHTKTAWVELDRSPKNDKRLRHMVNRYARLFSRQDNPDSNAIFTGTVNGEELGKVYILTLTAFQRDRYQAWFEKDEVEKTEIDEQRKIRVSDTTIKVNDVIQGRVSVLTLDEWLDAPPLPE